MIPEQNYHSPKYPNVQRLSKEGVAKRYSADFPRLKDINMQLEPTKDIKELAEEANKLVDDRIVRHTYAGLGHMGSREWVLTLIKYMGWYDEHDTAPITHYLEAHGLWQENEPFDPA